MNRLFFVSLGFLLLLIPSANAGAQHPVHAKSSAGVMFEHNFKTRIKGTDSKLSSSRYRVQGSYAFLTMTGEYAEYCWDKAGTAGLGDSGHTPWRGLYLFSLEARKSFMISPQWIFNLGAEAGSAFEKEISSSFWGRTDFSFTRILESGWSAGLGVAGVYHPVKSTAFPFIMLQYSSPEQHGFSARLGFPRTSVGYTFNEYLTARAYAAYTARIYRLKNDSPVQKKGYFEDRAYIFGMEMEIKPVQAMSITVSPYLLMERQIKTYDRKHNRQFKEKLKNSPGIKFYLSWNF